MLMRLNLPAGVDIEIKILAFMIKSDCLLTTKQNSCPKQVVSRESIKIDTWQTCQEMVKWMGSALKAGLIRRHKNYSFRSPKRHGMVAVEWLTVLRSEMMQPCPG